jgi:hypothetical protein
VEQLRRIRRLLEAVEHMNQIIKQNSHRFALHPLMAFQSAWNQPDILPVTKLAQWLWERYEHRPFFSLANKPQVRGLLPSISCRCVPLLWWWWWWWWWWWLC